MDKEKVRGAAEYWLCFVCAAIAWTAALGLLCIKVKSEFGPWTRLCSYRCKGGHIDVDDDEGEE